MEELKMFADKLAEALNDYGDTLDAEGIVPWRTQWEVDPHIDGLVAYAQDGWTISKCADHVVIGEPSWPSDYDELWNVENFDEAYLVLTHCYDDLAGKWIYKLAMHYAQDYSTHIGDVFVLPEKIDRPEYMLELCWAITSAYKHHRNDPDPE